MQVIKTNTPTLVHIGRHNFYEQRREMASSFTKKKFSTKPGILSKNDYNDMDGNQMHIHPLQETVNYISNTL